MRILVDSHIYIWAVLNDPRLTPKARRVLNSSENELFFSMASLWELSIKIRQGKLRTLTSSIAFLHDTLAGAGINVLSICYGDILCLEQLDIHHKDPFDRILIAQAINNELTLLTNDADIRKYPVQILW